MPIRLVIFDLDGTLVDSINDIANALNYSFEPYGIGSLTPIEAAGMVGEGTVRLIEKVLEKHRLSLDKNALFKRFAEYYSSHLLDNTMAYPGVSETLDALKDYRKAVVSNKFEALTLRILEELRDRKPSPIPIYYVLSALKIKSDEAMIVGDSVIDIDAGKASFIKTVAVTYGYGRTGFQENADFIISKMPELAAIVKGIK